MTKPFPKYLKFSDGFPRHKTFSNSYDGIPLLNVSSVNSVYTWQIMVVRGGIWDLNDSLTSPKIVVHVVSCKREDFHSFRPPLFRSIPDPKTYWPQRKLEPSRSKVSTFKSGLCPYWRNNFTDGVKSISPSTD